MIGGKDYCCDDKVCFWLLQCVPSSRAGGAGFGASLGCAKYSATESPVVSANNNNKERKEKIKAESRTQHRSGSALRNFTERLSRARCGAGFEMRTASAQISAVNGSVCCRENGPCYVVVTEVVAEPDSVQLQSKMNNMRLLAL